jgi:CheY-like chemotaxis protein/CHASE3 domain sensor protein
MTLSQKILAGFAACTVVLVSVAIFSFQNSAKFVDTNQWVNHTHEVINEFDQVLNAVIDGETGVRGFVITGNEAFLEDYRESKAVMQNRVDKVQELTADNPVQQQNIATLQKQISLRYRHLDDVVTLRRNGFEPARDLVATGKGKELQDDIRRTIAGCKNIENRLLAERKVNSEKDAANFNMVFIVLLLIIGLVLIVVYLIITANITALKRAELESAEKNWLLAGNFELNEVTRGERQAEELSQAIIEKVCTYLGAQIGVFYLQENGQLNLTGSYAFDFRKDNRPVIKIGEGLVGQAAHEKKTIVFTEVPADYIKINSGLGSIVPKNLAVLPLLQDGVLRGVMEIGMARGFNEQDMQFLKMISENLAIVVSAAQSRAKMKELLEETQRQAEELEAQQEELKQSNEELQEKTQLLERSEAELKAQQEELQQTNEELEEKANLLEEQKEKLEGAKMDIETKARELEVTSRYKSEFLANMSHELRTPLNSILILSQLLSENKAKSLTDKEVDFSKNIYNSGVDLLNLINEILDLSKVEAGKMDLEIDETRYEDVKNDLSAMFSEVARNKSIDFSIELNEPETGNSLTTDKQRLAQILRNLLSNAFKFTGKGGKVVLSASKAPRTAVYKNERLQNAAKVIAFKVTDTGIGIAEDKLSVVFEAFQQADGSTKRKYGGTGLGLSISRELANALGGEIQVSSVEGKGSTFVLYLPEKFDVSAATTIHKNIEVKEKRPVERTATEKNEIQKLDIEAGEVKDNRYDVQKGDKVILIMEDDPQFATFLLGFVNDNGYKGIIALQGNTGLSLARYYKPDAIMLDMKMPVMDGTQVLRHLKNDPELRHIPVQIISGQDNRKEGLDLGAFDFIRKPISKTDLQNAFGRIEEFVNRKLKRLLIVEDDETQNKVIRELIGNGDVKCFSAFSGKEAYDMMKAEHYDCVIIDLGLPDMPGFELIEKIKADADLNRTPIVVYTGRDLSKEENNRLNKLASAVVLKTVDSKERLLDETILFLHRVESKLPKEKQNIIRKLHKTDEVLRNKRVLVVDDDIRNIYSLTNALEEEGVECLTAENGKEALELLNKSDAVDIILMDVMMPEMDGYETTREIRADSKLNKIPIIALTAKAMKGDREKCLAAGMSDYVSKPVNIEQLLSLMRVWLYR